MPCSAREVMAPGAIVARAQLCINFTSRVLPKHACAASFYAPDAEKEHKCRLDFMRDAEHAFLGNVDGAVVKVDPNTPSSEVRGALGCPVSQQGHRGTRWQPSSPRPPQPRCGVRRKSSTSDEAASSRMTLTTIARYSRC